MAILNFCGNELNWLLGLLSLSLFHHASLFEVAVRTAGGCFETCGILEILGLDLVPDLARDSSPGDGPAMVVIAAEKKPSSPHSLVISSSWMARHRKL